MVDTANTSSRILMERSASADAATQLVVDGPVDVSGRLASSKPHNAMTVDVEEHFQVSAFENRIPRSEWNSQESRVERNVGRLLEMFDEAGAKATFFALGCVAERHPGMIREIVDNGHELASHGYAHSRVRDQSRNEFAEDVARTRKLLEDIGAVPITGYRAPSFSIGEDTPWAHDVLQEAGYRYSSSVYPIQHDHYGSTSTPRFAHLVRRGGLPEFPMTTVQAFGRNLPCAGGGYFRLMPLRYSKWATRRVNSRDQMPAIFYMHPWEIDPDQPRVDGVSAKTRFRHYVNLSRFEGRLAAMLRAFRWGRMDAVFSSVLQDEKTDDGPDV